ncbi:MAG: alpha-E domain-containing protein [Synechococcales cyanobacterium]
MLSRVADALYWLNRYVERAENIARFVDVNLNLILDSPSHLPQQWDPLIFTSGDVGSFRERYADSRAEHVIRFLAFDRESPNSIITCLRLARENARSIREIISSEMWEQINAFYLMVNEAVNHEPMTTLPAFFAEVKLASHLFAGVMDATMSHNEGWHFGQLGRYIERADKTARILDVKYFILLPSPGDVGSTLDELQWMALLKSASAYEMYRKLGQHRITPQQVAQFLIFDAEFPRSIQFCLAEADKSLHQITATPIGTWQRGSERTLGRLRSELGYLTIDEVVEEGLHEFLDRLQSQINTFGEHLFQEFFALPSLGLPVGIPDV